MIAKSPTIILLAVKFIGAKIVEGFKFKLRMAELDQVNYTINMAK